MIIIYLVATASSVPISWIFLCHFSQTHTLSHHIKKSTCWPSLFFLLPGSSIFSILPQSKPAQSRLSFLSFPFFLLSCACSWSRPSSPLPKKISTSPALPPVSQPALLSPSLIEGLVSLLYCRPFCLLSLLLISTHSTLPALFSSPLSHAPRCSARLNWVFKALCASSPRLLVISPSRLLPFHLHTCILSWCDLPSCLLPL